MNLTFFIGDLLKSEAEIHETNHSIDTDISPIDHSLKPKSNLVASLTLRRVGDSIGAFIKDGELIVELACLRCLKNFDYKLLLPTKERYFYLPSKFPKDDTPEENFTIDPETSSINLAEMLRQEILFALPAYPICKEDCPGLCQNCGNQRDDCVCNSINQKNGDESRGTGGQERRNTNKPLADLFRMWQEE